MSCLLLSKWAMYWNLWHDDWKIGQDKNNIIFVFKGLQTVKTSFKSHQTCPSWGEGEELKCSCRYNNEGKKHYFVGQLTTLWQCYIVENIVYTFHLTWRQCMSLTCVCFTWWPRYCVPKLKSNSFTMLLSLLSIFFSQCLSLFSIITWSHVMMVYHLFWPAII